MTIQPKHHWQFNERTGNITKDTKGGVEAKLHKTIFDRCGPTGLAVMLQEQGSHVNLGPEVGNFGTEDFTIAFSMLPIHSHKQNDLDIIGNRHVSGAGNWFSLRHEHGHILSFEVCEDSKKKNYAIAKSSKVLVFNQWCHIALVRKGAALRVYFNGVEVAKGESKNGGIAKINNNSIDVKLGHIKRKTAKARYEDLRIYDQALTESQIEALLPTENRLLQHGQVELIAKDGARRLLTNPHGHLHQLSSNFQKLRVGPDTGVTLYDKKDFLGTQQKLFDGIPDMTLGRIKTPPESIHIWPSADEPFKGQWVVRAPNGGYLSWQRGQLTTDKKCTSNELFGFNFNQNYGQLHLIPNVEHEGSSLSLGNEFSPMIVDDSVSGEGAFCITHKQQALWLSQAKDGKFSWTDNPESRATFFRTAKFAQHEGQVGELMSGEVALYANTGYHGKVWILSDGDDTIAGDFASLQSFFGLDNTTSSIRLGPDTGVTLFAHENQKVNEDKREKQIEDLVENTPNLFDSQIGNDTISSLKIFTRVSASKLFTSITSKLSQDYRMVNGELEEFSAYRTILRLDPDVKEVEVSATDLTTVEVEDESYVIDEVRSVILKPNMLNQIMITSEADGLDTPALKFRTQDMADNERVVISPTDALHQQLSTLENDALWNAKDAKGKLIVDQKKHSKAEVASVQNTVKRVMSSVTPNQVKADDNSDKGISSDEIRRTTVKPKLVVNTDDTSPWALNFETTQESNKNQSSTNTGSIVISGAKGGAKANNKIWEENIDQKAFDRLLLQAGAETVSNPTSRLLIVDGASSLRSIGGIFNDIGDAVKKATKVVVGFSNNIMNIIVDVAGKAVRFVLDSVQKVAEFVQAVIEKVVESIKQFIEFLQFLFNWDDILQTQRVLVKSVNSALDCAGDLVSSAQGHVTDFVDTLQEGLSDGVDSLITTLGGDPAEQEKTSGFELPEAAEWFLNKVLGGSKSSGSNTKPAGSTAQQESASDSLQQAFEHILEALKGVVGIGAEVLDGIIDTIESLITNPLKPELALVEILITLRNVGVQILDLGENLILAFLDMIVTAIRLFKDMLNLEIRIPFIAKLFEMTGAGKLTLLNLVSVLVAIPVTVVSKLIFGQAPFGSGVEPEFPKQIEKSNVRSAVLSVGKSTSDEPASEELDLDIDNIRRKTLGFGIVAIISDVLNGMIGSVLDLVPEEFDDEGNGVSGILENVSLMLTLQLH